MKPEILSVTAVTDNFPDGQKITAARIRYSGDVSGSFRPEDYRVEGRKILSAEAAGDTVVLTLEPQGLIPPPPRPPKGAGGPPPGKKGPPNLPPAIRHPVEVTVI